MTKQINLFIIILFCIATQVSAQGDKYNVSSAVFLNGEKYLGSNTILLTNETVFKITPTGSDTIENIEIIAFVTKGDKVLNHIVYSNLTDFNENFNQKIFKKVRREARLYFCLINKDHDKHNLNIALGDNEYKCDKFILIPIRKK